MDNPLILMKLFNFMGARERTWARLVCKAWCQLLDSIPLERLCIYEDKVPIGLRWVSTGECILESETVQLARQVRFAFEGGLFRNLKMLCVFKVQFTFVDLKTRTSYLEQLNELILVQHAKMYKSFLNLFLNM